MKDIEREFLELKAEVEKLRAMEEQVAEHEKKLRKYEGLAAKWGGFLLGVTTVGVILANGVEKLKDKLIQIVLP